MKKRLLLLVQLSVTSIVLVYLYSKVDFQSVAESLSYVKVGTLILAFFVNVVGADRKSVV